MKKNIVVPEIIDSVLSAEKMAIDSLFEMDKSEITKAISFIFKIKGKVIVSGIGKSAFVAQKFVATLNSTGTSAVFLHAGDAMHGDVGIIDKEDIVIFISKSGGSKEVVELLTYVKSTSVPTIGICNIPNSYLAQKSTISICIPGIVEADEENIIPTSSIISHLAICDCISIALQQMHSFTSEDFGKLHPRGTLGKQLATVESIAAQHTKPSVALNDPLQKVIYTISSNKLGACCVIGNDENIAGIITDGDIRRMIETNIDISGIVASDIMTSNPKSILGDTVSKDALHIMGEYNINQLLVIDADNKYIGMLHIQDLINE
ncbi:MAG: arabinose-5-phosphate isomerase [Saprospiraceae bacterium]